MYNWLFISIPLYLGIKVNDNQCEEILIALKENIAKDLLDD